MRSYKINVLSILYIDSYPELEELEDEDEVWDESEEVNQDIEPPSVEAYESLGSGDRQPSTLARWIVFFIAYLRAFHSLSDTVADRKLCGFLS